jgi:iron complex outermembrane receptor protein
MSRIAFGVLATGCLWATAGWAQSPIVLDTIDIDGRIPSAERQTRSPEPAQADTASTLRDVPNAALLDNGGISGQTQYRGSAGYRNAVRIDGMGIASGGPNWMDPPLHYAPAARRVGHRHRARVWRRSIRYAGSGCRRR